MTIAPPLLWSKTAQSVPRIHDITTDSNNPPEFFDILPLRINAVNPVEYGGEELAAVQRKAYPDIKPLTLTAPPQEVLPVAIQVANVMGWHVVSADRNIGRVEATATTFWFGFTDDIVIRVTYTMGGSRVDVRSLSRVGVSDAGTNAKRIAIYLKVLKERFES